MKFFYFNCIIFHSRRIVISIQSIFRMKYMVRRWQTRSKLATNIHLNIPNVYPSDLRFHFAWITFKILFVIFY